MNKELEKVCEELKPRPRGFDGVNHGYEIENYEYTAFKIGFKAAIESEQVQGLVKALELIYAGLDPDDWDSDCDGRIAKRALEKFKGEK